MPTTADYLNDLVAQKNSLAKTLADSSVEVGENETFSTLVPKANKKIMYSGEDNPLLTKLMNDEVFDFYDDTVTEWKSGIFAMTKIKSLSLPNCKTIGEYYGMLAPHPTGLFYGAMKLSSINLPKCTAIHGQGYGTLPMHGVFANTRITEVYLPECVEINSTCAFQDCIYLTKVDMPKLTTIGHSEGGNLTSCTFYGCTKLVEVNLPELTLVPKDYIDSSYEGWGHYRDFFGNCSSLQQISLPKARAIPYGTFLGCTNLSSVYAPLAEKVGYNAFSNCISLIELELPSCTFIASSGIGVKNLTKLTLSNGGTTMKFHNSAFTGATSLKTIIFDGVLFSDGTDNAKLNFSKNPLDLDTAKRIINCLENYAETENEYAHKVTFSSTTLSLLNAEGATAPGDITWTEYAYNKGWNI